ncbi:hypothetical protein EON65_35470, partial [archaeon]
MAESLHAQGNTAATVRLLRDMNDQRTMLKSNLLTLANFTKKGFHALHQKIDLLGQHMDGQNTQATEDMYDINLAMGDQSGPPTGMGVHQASKAMMTSNRLTKAYKANHPRAAGDIAVTSEYNPVQQKLALEQAARVLLMFNRMKNKQQSRQSEYGGYSGYDDYMPEVPSAGDETVFDENGRPLMSFDQAARLMLRFNKVTKQHRAGGHMHHEDETEAGEATEEDNDYDEPPMNKQQQQAKLTIERAARVLLMAHKSAAKKSAAKAATAADDVFILPSAGDESLPDAGEDVEEYAEVGSGSGSSLSKLSMQQTAKTLMQLSKLAKKHKLTPPPAAEIVPVTHHEQRLALDTAAKILMLQKKLVKKKQQQQQTNNGTSAAAANDETDTAAALVGDEEFVLLPPAGDESLPGEETDGARGSSMTVDQAARVLLKFTKLAKKHLKSGVDCEQSLTPQQEKIAMSTAVGILMKSRSLPKSCRQLPASPVIKPSDLPIDDPLAVDTYGRPLMSFDQAVRIMLQAKRLGASRTQTSTPYYSAPHGDNSPSPQEQNIALEQAARIVMLSNSLAKNHVKQVRDEPPPQPPVAPRVGGQRPLSRGRSEVPKGSTDTSSVATNVQKVAKAIVAASRLQKQHRDKLVVITGTGDMVLIPDQGAGMGAVQHTVNNVNASLPMDTLEQANNEYIPPSEIRSIVRVVQALQEMKRRKKRSANQGRGYAADEAEDEEEDDEFMFGPAGGDEGANVNYDVKDPVSKKSARKE